MIIHGGVHFSAMTFFLSRSHCDAVTLCWPTTPLWDRPRPAFGKEISSILFAWDAPDGGTSALHQVSAFSHFISERAIAYIFNFNSSGQLLVARGMGAIGVSGDGSGTHH